ncbi:MAG: type II toxin-antitoxin system PemK/MazF family toxin, partial [Armatimonadetes bacterium]|nr:type II toxin-antitoxin system PemK/MazF family toxin [Armatimonadota bacterium]
MYSAQLPGGDKERPVVIVSPDARNRFANDVIIVPLTTTARPSSTHVFLESGETGLRWLSVARCEQVTTLNKHYFGRGPPGGACALKYIL